MNSFVQGLTMTYLLYPILGLLLVGLGFFVAKKNALLGNKRLGVDSVMVGSYTDAETRLPNLPLPLLLAPPSRRHSLCLC